MKKIEPLAVSVAGSCCFSCFLFPSTAFLLRAAWGLSWFFLFLALTDMVAKRPGRAAVFTGISIISSLGWTIGRETSFQLYWIFVWTAALLYLWPLRFLSLGEFLFAFVFGPMFWAGSSCLASGTFSIAASTDGIPYPSGLLIAGSGVILFLSAFLKNVENYSYHKERQQYSLPVFLGGLFPALDRKWRNDPSLPFLRWLCTGLYIVLCGTGFLPALFTLLAN